jgi:hypothetical protein
VLVPSPTISPVFSVACPNMRAPRFSSAFFKSNSFAIVTPSLHTMGAPHFFSISTDLERGPSVTRTASASWVAPRRIFRARRSGTVPVYVAARAPVPAILVLEARVHRPAVRARLPSFHEPARLVDIGVIRIMMLPLSRTVCSLQICQNSHGDLASADGAGLNASNAETLKEIVGSAH